MPDNHDVEENTKQPVLKESTGELVAEGLTKEWVIENTNMELKENLSRDQLRIIRELRAAKDTEKRVRLFAKLTDKYWIDFIAWLIPILWDFTPAVVSTCYLLAEWIHIWLSRKDYLKILWYQTADLLVWSCPWIWDIADFFFKGNKYSSRLFSKHLEKLAEYAKQQWIPQDIIDKIVKDGTKANNKMGEYNKKYNKKCKRK